jgi:serine/threonine-protein kinase RsbW
MRNAMTVSFTSTLYLLPVLEVLLDCIPSDWHAEVHLGLQEALVNAAKHGNKLDPTKIISVLFSHSHDRCEWLISDEGDGFVPPNVCRSNLEETLCDDGECGRGLFILHQVFDQVQWNPCGTQLRLSKQIRYADRSPLLT